MRISIPAVLAVLASTSIAFAQLPVGATYRAPESVPSRGALLGNSGVLAARFDHSDYVGWGATGAPGTRVLRGVTLQSNDANGATAEAWSIAIYQENLANPGYPLLTAPVAMIPPIMNPVRPAGPANFLTTTVFATPIVLPADRDVFVGIGLTPATSWPADGHSVLAVLGAPSRWPTFDEPGPAPIQHMSYGLFVDAAGVATYNTVRQLLIELLCDAPGASCTAITNQASYPVSNAAPGTGSFLSGLHPDARIPPTNFGRADNIGFTFLDGSMPNGTPVVFLADFFAFGPELPLAALVPGSVGVLCLNQATAATVNFRFLLNGEVSEIVTIPAAIRPNIAGIPLVWQGIALNVAANALRASPCGRQIF